MVIVSARVRIKSEHIEEALEIAKVMQERTRTEAGCITYTMSQSIEDPSVFLVYEEWVDEAALTFHFETSHMSRFNARLVPFLSEAPKVTKYIASSLSIR